MPDFTFGDRELSACQRLVYAGRIATATDASGGHRVRRSGEGVDFLDYRRYAPGEDVRRIDWTVFARLRQPFIRILQHETLLHVNLLVDVSRSMAAGDPTSKAALACQTASALAYVALSNGDRVSVAAYSDILGPFRPDFRGRGALPRVVDLLREAPLKGRTHLAPVVRQFTRQSKHRGLTVILSDFLSPHDFSAPISQLLTCGFRVLAVQILDAADWGADLSGRIRLRDSETGRKLDVLLTDRRLEEYRRRLRAHCERLNAFCSRRDQFYLYADTHATFSQIVARGLRERGLFK